MSTNISNSVYNMGINSCNSGSQYCQSGYALYVPCLQNVTRGENTCFNFYVTDLSTQDTVNLDDVDTISLNLSGQYNCQYGTFSYPNNIESLQKNTYSLKYSCNFENKTLCQISLAAVDIENPNTYNDFKTSYFYSDNAVEVSAYDTVNNIFIGWATFEDSEDQCSEFNIDDYVISKSNIYSFIIKEDTRIFALYRKRKTYEISIDPKNQHSLYIVTYKDITCHLSNRDEEIFDDSEYDQYDKINVLEGYSVTIECVPVSVTLDSESDSEDYYMYKFAEWKDGNTNRVRVIKPGVDSSIFESGENKIQLFARCWGPVEPYELKSDETTILDVFYEDNNCVFIYTQQDESSESEEINEYEYLGDEQTKEIDNVNIQSINEKVYLHISNGKLVLNPLEINEGILIKIQTESYEECELNVEVNGVSVSNTINPDDDIDEIKNYYFSECNNSEITIYTYGDCLISNVEIYEVKVEDKGKARLCINSDDIIIESEDSETDDILFEDIPSGPIYISGAIAINDNVYGLSKVQIGNVNNLSKINIL